MNTCKFTTLKQHSAGNKYAPVQDGLVWNLANAAGGLLIGNRGKVYEFISENTARSWLINNLSRLKNSTKPTSNEYILKLGQYYIDEPKDYLIEEINAIEEYIRGVWQPVEDGAITECPPKEGVDVEGNIFKKIIRKTYAQFVQENYIAEDGEIIQLAENSKYYLGNGYNYIGYLQEIKSEVVSVKNVAHKDNGSIVRASSEIYGFSAESVSYGYRGSERWGNFGGWNDASMFQGGDWIEIEFLSVENINAIYIFTHSFYHTVDIVRSTPKNNEGLSGLNVQAYLNDGWVEVGQVSNNSLAWIAFDDLNIVTKKIRVNIAGFEQGYSRITGIEAYKAVR